MSWVGEVGVIKRDIAYSGDVLNTAARIQGKCNEFQTSILISKDVIDLLAPADIGAKTIGEIPLRGKAHAVELYTL